MVVLHMDRDHAATATGGVAAVAQSGLNPILEANTVCYKIGKVAVYLFKTELDVAGERVMRHAQPDGVLRRQGRRDEAGPRNMRGLVAHGFDECANGVWTVPLGVGIKHCRNVEPL